MTAKRWRKIEDLFQAALALPAVERPQFLDTACKGDDELRREIESLLHHDGNSADIASVVHDVAGCFSEEEAASLIGRRIGAYRVTGVIGRGGMGLVCAAVRDDEEFSKQVAIKLIKRGMDTMSVIGRFRGERQILASLEHPGIARLIDGGATEDGQPYFVMEHVDGHPITTYCELNRLSIAGRLKLFRLVCEAVQYAHRNLVVHRDIKPSNILVTNDGSPKLLDFGLAKVLHAQSAIPQTVTALTERMLTPDYASPEQVRSSRATTSTDVYSLGAVLYELLSGERPHHLSEYTPLEIERVICQTEIDRPSSAVLRSTRLPERARRHWARQLRGDLDNIVLKALRKEPERRYASVEQFSDDLQRYLEGMPVTARPDVVLYRVRKFVGRHKLSVTAAAVAGVSLAAGGFSTAYQARRAEQRFQQVRKLANVFLFDLHDRLRPLPGSIETRRFVVKTGLEYLATLERDAGADNELLLELAQAYQRIGDLQGNPFQSNLGDPGGAMASYRKAAGILETLGLRGSDDEAKISLAETCAKIGALHDNRGELTGGLESYRSALKIAEHLGSRRDEPRILEIMGRLHSGVARILSRQGDSEAAEKHASAALAVMTNLVAIDPKNRVYQTDLSTSHRFMATTLERTGRRSQALGHYLAALRIREALAADAPQDTDSLRMLMLAYSHLGDFLKSNLNVPSDYEGALVHHRKMLQIAEKLSGQDAKDKRAQVDLSESLLRVGATLADLGRFAEALSYLRRSLRVTAQLLRADLNSFALRFNVAYLNEKIANALSGHGETEEARTHSHASVEAVERLLEKTTKREVLVHQALVSYKTHVKLLGQSGDQAGVSAASARILQLAATTSPEKVSNQLILYSAPVALAAAGEAHEFLAQDTADSSARLEEWQEACAWFEKSVQRWEEIQSFGVTVGVYESEPAVARKQLASCQAQVQRLQRATP